MRLRRGAPRVTSPAVVAAAAFAGLAIAAGACGPTGMRKASGDDEEEPEDDSEGAGGSGGGSSALGGARATSGTGGGGGSSASSSGDQRGGADAGAPSTSRPGSPAADGGVPPRSDPFPDAGTLASPPRDSGPTGAGGGGGATSSELRRGLVGFWRFNDGRPDIAVDSSDSANHAGLKNFTAADLKPGKEGMALLFTPARRTYVSVPSHPSLSPSSAITLAAWINAADWAGSRRIAQKGDSDNQYRLFAEAGQLKFHVQLASATTPPAVVGAAPPAAGQWAHVAGTYDGRALRLYVNGAPVASQPAAGPLQVTASNLHIGAKSPASPTESELWSGLIDDVALYDRALSDAEVRALAGGSSP